MRPTSGGSPAALDEQGVTVYKDVGPGVYGLTVYLADPDGNRIELFAEDEDLTGAGQGDGVAWERLLIAVVGGDDRDPEIARLAAATGAEVRVFGVPWPAEGIPGVELAGDALGAVTGANYLLLPIPVGVGLEVYAPHAERPITADVQFLRRSCARGARVSRQGDRGVPGGGGGGQGQHPRVRPGS